MNSSPSKLIFRRLVATTLAAIAIVGNPDAPTRRAYAAPADIFTSAVPGLGASAPAGAAIKANEASVSGQTGALQYSYPITMPPGRNGMTPSLALSYSSQAPIYGGIAAGWTLEVPMIKTDVSKGVLKTQGGMADQEDVKNSVDIRKNDLFVSTMAAGRPLVETSEPKDPSVYATYRAKNDSSFARYERMNSSAGFRWRVRTSDGHTYVFGETLNLDTCKGSDGYAPLTSHTDEFGNVVRYYYTGWFGFSECDLVRVDYGENAAAGMSKLLARVTLNYGEALRCSDTNSDWIGSQTDLRDGERRYMGIRPLTSISVRSEGHVFDTHTRTVSINYDWPGTTSLSNGLAACAGQFAPFRQLSSISETVTATGKATVTLPTVSFAYGSANIQRTTAMSGSMVRPSGVRYHDLAELWPLVKKMALDYNGDGRTDQLEIDDTDLSECRVKWQANTPSGMVNMPSFVLPRLPWTDGASTRGQRDTCALNAQYTFFKSSVLPATSCPSPSASSGTYLTYRWMDNEGDGLPDLVYAIHYDPDQFDPEASALLSPAPACGVGPSPGECTAYPYSAVGNGLINNAVNAPPVLNYGAFAQAEVSGAATNSRCGLHATALQKDVPPPQPDPPPEPVPEPCPGDCGTGIFPETCGQIGQVPCLDGSFPDVPEEPPDQPGYCNAERQAHKKCNLYPWWMKRNVNGQLASTAVVKMQPLPLESDSGDSTMVGAAVGPTQGFVDVDGDGRLDALLVGHNDTTTLGAGLNPLAIVNQPRYWMVMPGDGAGGFLRRGSRFSFLFGTPPLAVLSSSVYRTPELQTNVPQFDTGQLVSIADINGDGLVDYWRPSYNLTEGFGQVTALYPGPIGVGLNNGLSVEHYTISSNLPDVGRSHIEATSYSEASRPFWIRQGTHQSYTTLKDLDADGRPDLVTRQSNNTMLVRYNQGFTFGDVGSTVPDAVKREVVTQSGPSVTYGPTATPSVTESAFWTLRSDVIDTDGDGISEVHSSSAPALAHNPAGRPPRLLYQITNGRGATTEITYAPVNGTSVAWINPVTGATENPVIVEQRPELGDRMPNTMWVVAVTSTKDNIANTTTSSLTQYKNPVFSEEPETGKPGKWGFRGFREVTTTGPTGAKTIQRYGYGQYVPARPGDTTSEDWSGRPTTTVVMTADNQVVSMSKTYWQGFSTLGNFDLRTFMPIRESKYTCSAGATETSCLGAPAGFSKTRTVYSGYPNNTSAQVWAATKTTLQGPASLADNSLAPPTLTAGDRVTDTDYTLVSNATTYRFHSGGIETGASPGTALGTRKYMQSGGNLVLYGKTETGWDASFRVPLKQRTYFSAGTTDYAESRSVYDMTTGNLLEAWKPIQNAANTAKTTYTYDAHKLWVASETNELGHVIDYVRDYGTGATMSVKGPNIRTCITGDPGCTGPVKQETNTKIDAIGRPLVISTTIGGGAFWTPYDIQWFTYKDVAERIVVLASGQVPEQVNWIPTWVSTEKLIELDTTRKTYERSYFDGSGRLASSRLSSNGAVNFDAVTSYTYGDDGKLISVATPDPTQNNSAQVVTTYRFDSIGRPTGVRFPDNTLPALPSGIDMSYDGLSSTTTEVLRANDGVAASKTTRMDSFGRLVLVSEKDGATSQNTAYTYAPNDTMATITDPAGLVTTLTHDFAGRRLSIGRSSKTWTYAYDKNNNMTSESFPKPAAALAVNYTNTMAYDALDRMTSRLIGKRALSSADEALFGSRYYTYSWDEGRNGIGKMTYARAFKSNAAATAPTAFLTYLHDGQGNRIITRQELTLDGMAPITREFQQSFTPNYGPYVTYFRDAFTATSPNLTSTETVYDNRGMPQQLNLIRGGQTTQTIAVQTRNVAGLVTKRRTDQLAGTGAMPFIESNWTYDKLGRPTDQTVVKGATTAQTATAVVRQQLQYFGNSDPKQLIQTLGSGTARTLGFTYDTRHQLTNVAGGTAFSGGYAFNAAGRLNTAVIGAAALASSIDVKPRSVTYIYGTGGANVSPTQVLGAVAGVDKEAVAKLTSFCANADKATCPSYAEYNYDDAGNQTKRKYVGTNETWDYLYDGEDNLRRVTKKTGATVNAIEEYWYDEAGARIAIIKRNGAGVKQELRWFIGGAEAHYALSAATPAVATLSKVYSHASLGTPVARIERTANAVNTLEYQFHGLGFNTIAAVSSEGVVNASFAYAPYGEVIESTDAGGAANGKDKHRRRITDKYVDEASGLAYFGARYYDNILMGWTQGDPLYRFKPDAAWVEPRKANLYQYVLSNPVRYTDPDGLNPSSLDAIAMRGFTFIPRVVDRPTEPYFETRPVVGIGPTQEGPPVTVGARILINYAQQIVSEGAESQGLGPLGYIPGVGKGVQALEKIDSILRDDPVDITSVSPKPIGGLVGLPGSAQPKGTAGGERAGKGFTAKDKKAIDERNAAANGGQNVCDNCKTPTTPGTPRTRGSTVAPTEKQRDHIHPRAKGGDGSPENAQILCAGCNSKKSDNLP